MREQKRKFDLGHPSWQGISAIAGILSVLIGAWGVYLYYNPPQHKEATQNVTATVTPIPTTQATSAAQPTVTITVNLQTTKQTATSEKTYECLVVNDHAPNYTYPCTKADSDGQLTIALWSLVGSFVIVGIIGIRSFIKWKNRY